MKNCKKVSNALIILAMYFRGGGSNFALVRQDFWKLLNVWKKAAITITKL